MKARNDSFSTAGPQQSRPEPTPPHDSRRIAEASGAHRDGWLVALAGASLTGEPQ